MVWIEEWIAIFGPDWRNELRFLGPDWGMNCDFWSRLRNELACNVCSSWPSQYHFWKSALRQSISLSNQLSNTIHTACSYLCYFIGDSTLEFYWFQQPLQSQTCKPYSLGKNIRPTFSFNILNCMHTLANLWSEPWLQIFCQIWDIMYIFQDIQEKLWSNAFTQTVNQGHHAQK